LLRLIVCSFALPKTTLFFLWVFFAGMFEVFFFLGGGLDLSFILGSVAIWSLRIFCFYESEFNFVPLASFKNCNFFLSLVFVGLEYQRQGYRV
jgi:hypothetical protein